MGDESEDPEEPSADDGSQESADRTSPESEDPAVGADDAPEDAGSEPTEDPPGEEGSFFNGESPPPADDSSDRPDDADAEAPTESTASEDAYDSDIDPNKSRPTRESDIEDPYYTGEDIEYEGPTPAAAETEGGPTADDEMPLTEHIREMMVRLFVVVAVAGVVSVATYPFAEGIINFLWNSILDVEASTRPRLYGVLELLFTKLKVASLAGLIIALPVIVYQTYQFMKPGLYPHERRYYLAAVPTSLVLALLGVSFAYFVVLPAVFVYFLHYSEGVAVIGFALGRTFNLILVLMGYLAIVFQIPLFILLAMMMGVVTRQWLADRRLLFWGGFLGISFLLFGPTDPTGASPFLVTITMILLFEATLFLVKWTRRARRS